MKTIKLELSLRNEWSLGLTADRSHIGVDLLWFSAVINFAP